MVRGSIRMLAPERRWRVVTAVVTLAYVVWLGARWLPLASGLGELDLFASRVADLRALLSHDAAVPYWTPTFMSGSSYALHHSQALYAVPWLLASSVLDLEKAGKVCALLELAAASGAMFLLARHLWKNELAAAICAVVYLLHPQTFLRTCAAEHMGVVAFLPTLPLAWLATLRVLERPTWARAFGCAVALLAMLWAHNKLAVMSGLFLGAHAVALTLSAERRRDPLIGIARTAALALPLGAFLFVPALSELKLVALFEGRPVDAWRDTYAVGLADLLTPIGGKGEYIGAAALVVAVLSAALGAAHTLRLRASLALALVLGVAAAHGPRSIAAATLADVASGTERGARALVATIGLVVLAGGGLLAIARHGRGRPRWLAGALATYAGGCALLLFVPLFAWVVRVPLLAQIRSPAIFVEVPGAFFLALLAGSAAETFRGGRRGTALLLVGLGALLADRWPLERRLASWSLTHAERASAEAAVGAAAREIAATGAPARGQRMFFVSDRMYPMMSNAWGGPPLAIEAGFAFMGPRGSAEIAHLGSPAILHATFDTLAVRLVLWDKDAPSNARAGRMLAVLRRELEIVFEDEHVVVLRNARARPLVSVLPRRALWYGASSEIASLGVRLAERGVALVPANGTSDPAGAVAIHDAGAPLPPPSADVDAHASFERRGPTEIDAHVDARARTTVFVAESYYPFWHAEVDGRPAPVLEVAGGLIGVDVDAGAHDVVLRYRPPWFYGAAWLLSAATFFGALGVVAFRNARSRSSIGGAQGRTT